MASPVRSAPGLFGGRFRILDELGRGGMGVVFRAEDLESAGREVALKVMQATSDDATRRERLRREAELTAGLDHPGVVRVLGSGIDDARPWVAYELVPGARTFAEVMHGTTLRRRVEIVRDAARALGHAHARGVVHRDVKPGNILIDVAGLVRVADFGLATARDLERLTTTGALLGTPLYMAPEQVEVRRDAIGPATDVWALGVLLYEVLAGERPFESTSFQVLLSQISRAAVPPPSTVAAEAPAALDPVCLRALARRHDERYEDGEALAAALDAWLHAPTGAAPAPRSAGRALLPWLLWLATAAALVATLARPGPPAPAPADPVADLQALAESGDAGAMRALARRHALGVGGPVDLAAARRWLQRAAEAGDAGAMVEFGRLQRSAGNADGGAFWLRQAADTSDPLAQCAWADYLREDGSWVEALRYYRQAAEADVPDALFRVGYAYEKGLGGLEVDYDQAAAWYERAANAGSPAGAGNLGYLHGTGLGRPVDRQEAARWYEVGARLGSAICASNLGFFAEKRGDYSEAVERYRQSARLGYPKAMTNLGDLLADGRGGERDEEAAAGWYLRAAESGYGRAMVELGLCYQEGRGVPADDVAAADWLRRGAEAGRWRGMLEYGRCLEEGRGVARDAAAALELYRRAGTQGYAPAQARVGALLLEAPPGVQRDVEHAERVLGLAAEEGDLEAMTTLGRHLLDPPAGRGAEPERGVELLERAAAADFVPAMRALGLVYREGLGVPVDEPQGVRWLRRAAEAGDDEAARLIAGEPPRDR